MGEELGPPFKRGRGGPGGWVILDEPELHLGPNVLVPDLAGWVLERMPVLVDDVPYFDVAPDWVCEVQSRGTAKRDRALKLPLYAKAGVRWAWMVDPLQRTLEVLRLESGRWSLMGTHCDAARVRAEPFDAIELELSALWHGVVLRTDDEGTR